MKNIHPKIDINRLREIGWSLWDPIGLDGKTGVWREEGFADEYDSYLVKVAEMIRNQCEVDEAVNYLFVIETEHMGLDNGTDEAKNRERLQMVVQAISSDLLIWSNCKEDDPSSYR